MTMPFRNNTPIEVFEDETHFLVRIHPEQRDRAKKISGRQWDGNRKVWVYPKDLATYEALVEEFQKDADIFDIRKPKTQRPPGIKPPEKKLDDEEFEDQLLDEISSLDEISESQGKIQNELEQIRSLLESLRDDSANQSRTIEEVRETQEQATRLLNNLELSNQQPLNTEPVEVLPEILSLTKQKEIELLEKALIMIACSTSGSKKSFFDWMKKHAPLSRPTEFVLETHEFLKQQLGKIVGDENPKTKFAALVDRVKDEKLIYRSENDLAPNLIRILFTLNTHRNRFGHSSEFSQWEKWSGSILYLMNLALVWSRIVMEVEENDE